MLKTGVQQPGWVQVYTGSLLMRNAYALKPASIRARPPTWSSPSRV